MHLSLSPGLSQSPLSSLRISPPFPCMCSRPLSQGNLLSYVNSKQTIASAGAVLLENVEEMVLPQMPCQTTMTMHDQRFHYVQRLLGCRELVSVSNQVLSIIYDDASKRGVSFLGSAILGSRSDGSLFFEILRVSRLLKDVETNTTKSGLNGARGLIAGTENFAGDQLVKLLWSVGVILCDTTGSNTGTMIVSGKGGSASHFRSRIEELTRGGNGEQGHILIEQRDCLSHAGHNECEAGMTAMGYCADDRVHLSSSKEKEKSSISGVKEIDVSKGSKRRVWAKNLLDEMSEYVGDRPKLPRFIEDEEGLDKRLAKPVTGTKERWGYYGKAGRYYKFTTGRIELIVRFALSMEPRRPVDGRAYEDLSPFEKIEYVKDAGVRAMLHELINPEKRLQLIVFIWYFDYSLDPYLGFTQSKRARQIARAHRIIRKRLCLFLSLRGTRASADGSAGDTVMWEPDAPDSPWTTQLEPILSNFISSQHDWVFSEVNARSLTRTFFEAVHDDFYTRTRGFWSPLCLIWGVLDEKGDAVLTAQELVKMAGAQGPMVTFPKLIAFDLDNAQRKGSLHEGITARHVVKAITDSNYHGPCQAFLPDIWKHVVALSKMDASTVLRNVPTLSPLFNLLSPMAENQSVSNGGDFALRRRVHHEEDWQGLQASTEGAGRDCVPQRGRRLPRS